MTVEHPHPILSRALKRYSKFLSPEQMTALGRSSWQILTDMYASSILDWQKTLTHVFRYTTPLCICYPVQTLAAASFLLAWHTLSETLPALPEDWTDSFSLDWTSEEEVSEVESIIERITDHWLKARTEGTKDEARRLKQAMPRATTFVKSKSEPQDAVKSDAVQMEDVDMPSPIKDYDGPPTPG